MFNYKNWGISQTIFMGALGIVVSWWIFSFISTLTGWIFVPIISGILTTLAGIVVIIIRCQEIDEKERQQ